MARRSRKRSRTKKKAAGSALRRRLRSAGLALLALALGALAWELATFPDVDGLREGQPDETAFMRYRREQAEHSGRRYRIRRTWVPLEQISPHLQRAVVAAEDARFYQHRGFDARAIDRALSDNLREGRIVRGGSTITQQLAKNLYLSPRRSWLRKGHETLYTYALERALTKQRILELYLNSVEWGDGIFGAELAARAHFGLPASRLTRHQAAALAVALPNPLERDPVRPSPAMRRRMERVLRGMHHLEARELRRHPR